MVSKTIGWEFESLHPCVKCMFKIKKYILEIIQEVVYKVTWPSYYKLRNSSFLVLVVSLILALLIGLVDWSLKRTFLGFYNVF